MLEYIGIHVSEETMLRIGGNFFAIRMSQQDLFMQNYDELTGFDLGERSKEFNCTYFDLINEHVGNIPSLKVRHRIMT